MHGKVIDPAGVRCQSNSDSCAAKADPAYQGWGDEVELTLDNRLAAVQRADAQEFARRAVADAGVILERRYRFGLPISTEMHRRII